MHQADPTLSSYSGLLHRTLTLTFTAQLIYSLSANGHCESRLSQREHQKRKGRKERRQRDGRLSDERTANRLRMV